MHKKIKTDTGKDSKSESYLFSCRLHPRNKREALAIEAIKKKLDAGMSKREILTDAMADPPLEISADTTFSVNTLRRIIVEAIQAVKD